MPGRRTPPQGTGLTAQHTPAESYVHALRECSGMSLELEACRSGGYVRAGVRRLLEVEVQRIGFLGVRTHCVAETTAFFRDVVGLPAVATGEHRTVTQLPTGRWDFVEVFGSDFHDERLIPPEADGIFVAIFVEDVEEARRDCEAAGVEILGEIIWAEQAFGKPEYAGTGWFFVRAPDENVYVFQQVAG